MKSCLPGPGAAHLGVELSIWVRGFHLDDQCLTGWPAWDRGSLALSQGRVLWRHTDRAGPRQLLHLWDSKLFPLRSVRLSYGLPVLMPSSHMPVPAASLHPFSATLSSHWLGTPLSLQVLGFQERLKSDSVSLIFSANHRSLSSLGKPFSKLDAHPWSSEQWSEGHVAQMQPCTLGERRGWTGMAIGCI